MQTYIGSDRGMPVAAQFARKLCIAGLCLPDGGIHAQCKHKLFFIGIGCNMLAIGLGLWYR